MHEQPFLRELEQLSLRIDVSKAFFKNTSLRLLDVFVDSMFEFVDQPLLPSQVR
jgi:carotenoid cleavage dioxygenase